MSDKPTGVFVRLPLDEAQIMKLYNPKKSGNENLLAIGTPVTGGELTVYLTADVLQHGGVKQIPLVRLEDAQAALVERYHAEWVAGKRDAHLSYTSQIAALEAEVVRLREAIHKIIDMSRNAQTWSLNNRAASCRDELSAIGRLGEKTLKGGAA